MIRTPPPRRSRASIKRPPPAVVRARQDGHRAAGSARPVDLPAGRPVPPATTAASAAARPRSRPAPRRRWPSWLRIMALPYASRSSARSARAGLVGEAGQLPQNGELGAAAFEGRDHGLVNGRRAMGGAEIDQAEAAGPARPADRPDKAGPPSSATPGTLSSR